MKKILWYFYNLYSVIKGQNTYFPRKYSFFGYILSLKIKVFVSVTRILILTYIVLILH